MKAIPAFNLACDTPAVSDRRPATMAMLIMHAEEPNSMSLRRPTKSISAMPVNAPHIEVMELTRLSLGSVGSMLKGPTCAGSLVSVIPAIPRRVGRKSTSAYCHRGGLTSDKTVAGDSLPYGDDSSDKRPPTVRRRVEDGSQVPKSLVGPGQRDGLLNLANLKPHKRRIDVPVARVQIGQDLNGFFGMAVSVVSTGCLWEEQDKAEVDGGWGTL